MKRVVVSAESAWMDGVRAVYCVIDGHLKMLGMSELPNLTGLHLFSLIEGMTIDEAKEKVAAFNADRPVGDGSHATTLTFWWREWESRYIWRDR